jgi:hypothetical protein
MEQPKICQGKYKSDTPSLHAWIQLHRHTMSEIWWGSCACLLFLLSGPFCTPVVLLALAHLARKAQQEGIQEPLSL